MTTTRRPRPLPLLDPCLMDCGREADAGSDLCPPCDRQMEAARREMAR